MESKRAEAESIDEYIARFDKGTRALLQEMRRIIRKAVPGAQEKISYQMPTFWLGVNIAHFAGYEKHIGFYPGAAPIRVFAKEIARYKYAKGSIQFPLDEPLPAALITRIVAFRVKERTEKEKAKAKQEPKAKPKAGLKPKPAAKRKAAVKKKPA